MKVHKWADIKRRFFTDEEIADLKRRARQELLEMDLRTLRKFVGKTQVEMAKAVRLSQSEFSRAETREDHRLSTIRRYVEALGGELEVIARFGDTSIRLKSI